MGNLEQSKHDYLECLKKLAKGGTVPGGCKMCGGKVHKKKIKDGTMDKKKMKGGLFKKKKVTY